MLKIIAIIIVLVIAAILIYATTLPDAFRMARSTTIKASPEKVSALLAHYFPVTGPQLNEQPNKPTIL